jgi:uncharacterized protein
MQISISQFKKSPGTAASFQLEERLPVLDLAGEVGKLLSPVKLQLSVSNTGDLLLVKGFLEAVLELECALCLTPFAYPIQTSFEEEYRLTQEAGDGSGEDENPFVGDKDCLDLKGPVIESLILSLPMKPLCQPDCRGLCPYCGRNRNETTCDCREAEIDPRLAVLQKLLDKDGREKEV